MKNFVTADIQKSLRELESESAWYRRIAEKVQPYFDTKDPRIAKKFRLDQVLRISRRVDAYADICEECRNDKGEISAMVDDLGNTMQSNDKSTLTGYFRKIESIKSHLKGKHNLVEKHHYLTTFSSIGTALAIGTGTALEDFRYAAYAAGIVCIAVGLWLDHKAKKEGRIL